MERIREAKKLHQVPRPCDYFDLIGGTSTGGIIAIMLGRLGMTVDECIRAYKKVAQQAFTPKRRSIFPAPPSGAFSATQLESAIKGTIREHCVNPQCVERRRRDTMASEACMHEEMEFRDASCTKTVVLAITKGNIDTLPTLFKTYDSSASLSGCTIWQVARATSAATTFFKPIRVGRDDVEFVDAGFGYNNPCEVLIAEAQKQFPDRESMQVLSIGTGLGDVVAITNTRKSILRALGKMATSSKKVASRLDERYGDSGVYHRFNVDHGLEDVKLSDWKKASKISSHTQNYLTENERMVKKFADICIQATCIESDVRATEESRRSERRSTHNIPFPKNKDFVGRTAIINTLMQMLFAQIDTLQVALVGLGGMGKTQVALHLAHWVKNNKSGYSVLWIPAFSLASFQQTCIDLVRELNIQCAENEDAKESVRRHLSSEHVGNWFLIVDNIDETDVLDGAPQQRDGIFHFLPQSDSGRILFTTRSQEVAVAVAGSAVVRLSEMNPEEALSFLGKALIHKSQIQDNESAVELLGELTHLPLAIAQASAYMNVNDVTIKDYLRLFRKTDRDMIRLLETRFRDRTHHDASQGAVATTWMVSFDQIRKHDRFATALLSFIACIEPKAVPRPLLPSFETEEQLTSAIGMLCGYGFLSRREDKEVFDMHSLVHFMTRKWTKEQKVMETTLQAVIRHLARIFPSDRWENRELWQQYLPHALRVLRRSEGAESEELPHLGCLAKEALKLLKHIVAIYEKISVEDNPDRLDAQCALAMVYQANGQAKEALKLLKYVVAIYEKISVEDNPNRLAAQISLAGVYQANGQVKEALELLEHAVAICEKTLAEDHPLRLTAQHQLATTYQA
ncbi:hypothetical protein LZL87_013839 [Fusarium oxysporum]|nr:hypothetical protein LZL87_013839 [Fusarium oxysporum]